tara:strand:- start:372 stop:728 length:357 start_codon:yes stop_codon:yes gene_type:complete
MPQANTEMTRVLIGHCADLEVKAHASSNHPVESNEWIAESAFMRGRHMILTDLGKVLYGEEFEHSYLYERLVIVHRIMSEQILEAESEGRIIPTGELKVGIVESVQRDDNQDESQPGT